MPQFIIHTVHKKSVDSIFNNTDFISIFTVFTRLLSEKKLIFRNAMQTHTTTGTEVPLPEKRLEMLKLIL